MGGYGSGRKFGADCAEDYRSIDIRRWQRDGYLTPGRSFRTYWTVNGEEAASIGVQTQTGRVILSFERLQLEHDDFAEQSLFGIMRHFKITI